MTSWYVKIAQRGFTLIELIVTVSILLIILGVILVQSQGSREDLLITNEMYEVALLARKAQSFGVAVRESTTGSFDQSYGIFINTAQNNRVVLFADTDTSSSPNYFTGGDLIEEELTLDAGIIDEFCGTDAGGEDCSINNLSIAFLRPDPDAIITGNNGSRTFVEARIDVTSANGARKRIRIFSTGQIAIEENP